MSAIYTGCYCNLVGYRPIVSTSPTFSYRLRIYYRLITNFYVHHHNQSGRLRVDFQPSHRKSGEGLEAAVSEPQTHQLLSATQRMQCSKFSLITTK